MICCDPLPLPPCECPKVILSRSFYSLVQSAGGFYINGTYHYATLNPRSSAKQVLAAASFYYKEFLDTKNFYSLSSNLSKITAFNIWEKKWFPLLMIVPCNHCVVCRKIRQNAWSDRACLESQVHQFKPFFLCLTYDNEHLPIEFKITEHFGSDFKEYWDSQPSDPFYAPLWDAEPQESIKSFSHYTTIETYHNLIKEDYQKFLKRFRYYLNIRYHLTCRYIVAGHYGTKHGRPHFHFVFWINETFCGTETDLYNFVSECCRAAWDKGIIDLQVAKDSSNVGGYCAGYLAHADSEVAQGYIPTFIHASCGRGGIGQPFLDQHYQIFHMPQFTSIKFLDVWSGQVKDMPFTSFLVKKIFPSVCSLIRRNQPTFMDDYRACCSIYNDCLDYYSHFYSDVTWLHGVGKILEFLRVDPLHMDSFPRSYSIEHPPSFYNFDFFDKGKILLNNVKNYISQYIPFAYKIYAYLPIRNRFLDNFLNSPLRDMYKTIQWADKDYVYHLEHAVF